MINRLNTKRGVTNLPISCVIINYATPLTMDHSKLIIYNSESMKVVHLLTHLVIYTDAFNGVVESSPRAR